MKRYVFSLLGLIMTVSAEASHVESLRTFSDADSRQSFCSTRCEVLKENLQSNAEQIIADIKAKLSEEKQTDFSLPTVAKCQTDHYSFFGANFIRTKLFSGSEILFPTNGCQMSPEEVVQLSGANLDDGLVTKFYMAMFGLIKWEGEYLEMGFDERNHAYRILNVDSMSSRKRKNFIRNFYKIASTSVGRTLLYRLLLEIRRTDTKNNNGCIDNFIHKTLIPEDLDKRNTCRSIKIITPYDTKSNSFNRGMKSINFYPSKDKKKTSTFGVKKDDKIEIIKSSRTDDVGLFHEMLHWFHMLRDPERKNREAQIQCKTNDKELLISKALMGSEKLELWIGREEKGNSSSELILKMEEVRTIMGYTFNFLITIDEKTISYFAEEVINGDDLSENLYRLCVGQQLRYGHVTKETMIPIKIADRVRKFYDEIMKNYRMKNH